MIFHHPNYLILANYLILGGSVPHKSLPFMGK